MIEFIKKYLLMFLKKNITPEEDSYEETMKQIDERRHKEEIKHIIFNKELIIPRHYMDKLDYKDIPSPSSLRNDNEKVLLIVDDIEYTDLLYIDDFNLIEKDYGYKVYDEYRVIKAYGKDAGKIVWDYFILNDCRLDKAIIDLTLGENIHIDDIGIKELDGIDLATYLYSKYNNKVLICTAHTLSTENTVIKTYVNKCKKYLGVDLKDIYINKNEERYHKIYNLLNS